MSNRKIRDKLYAVGLYLLFGVVLFLAMMGLKYVLIAICAYAGVQLVLDLFTSPVECARKAVLTDISRPLQSFTKMTNTVFAGIPTW